MGRKIMWTERRTQGKEEARRKERRKTYSGGVGREKGGVQE